MQLLLYSPALSFPLAPSTPPPIPGTSIERGVVGTADTSLRRLQGTHTWSCGHTHGQVIRAWCRDSDLELIKGEVTLAKPSAKPSKRVQKPPCQRDALLSLKTQPPGLLPTTTSNETPALIDTCTAALSVPTEDPASQR